MQIKKLHIFFTLVWFHGHGQNLVLNPSFENYEKCERQDGASSLPTSFLWWEPNGSSVDIYSDCNGTVPESKTSNWYVNQYPKHGRNFIGCVLSDPGLFNYREFAESELTMQLQKGSLYLLSFYCCNSEGFSLEIKNIHLGFAKKKKQSPFFFNKHSVINPFRDSDTIYPNLEEWLHKSTLYEASGKEKYVVLGNFNSRFKVKKKEQKDSKYGAFRQAYYLYDDISVIEVPKNYIETRLDSTVLYSDYKMVNQPSVGDTITIPGLSFNMNEKSLSTEFDELLKSLSDYLLINPFLVINLSLNEETDYSGKRRGRLFSDREENLMLRFEELGVSSNRIHYNWIDTETDKAGFFIIHDNIDGEVLKMDSK